jgi:hypothetical protein
MCKNWCAMLFVSALETFRLFRHVTFAPENRRNLDNPKQSLRKGVQGAAVRALRLENSTVEIGGSD